MSANLHVVEENAPELRSVALALQQETVTWEFADAVYDEVLAFEQGVATPSSDQSNTGLSAAEDKVYEAHRNAGTEKTRSALHNTFVTRRVWPPEERRPELASFSVHYELRGKDYRNRRELIEKYASRSKTGRWSLHDMRRWKSERKPKEFQTFIQIIDGRVRRAVKTSGQPWTLLADTDRQQIADLLRVLAREIEDGVFPAAT